MIKTATQTGRSFACFLRAAIDRKRAAAIAMADAVVRSRKTGHCFCRAQMGNIFIGSSFIYGGGCGIICSKIMSFQGGFSHEQYAEIFV